MDPNAGFRNYYESLVFEDIKNCESGTSSSLTAETQRKVIAQLYFSASNADVAGDSHVGLLLHDQHLKRYCQIVDNRDPVKGLDNYSKGALALSSSFRNESRQWSLKDLPTSTGFQQLENELRKENGSYGNFVSDLEKTLDYIRKLEDKVEETSLGPLSSSAAKEWRQDPDVTKPLPSFPSKLHPRIPVKKMETVKSDPGIYRSVKEQPVADHRFAEKKAEESVKPNAFRTAKDQLIADQRKKNAAGNNAPPTSYGSRPKSLGTRRGLNSPFIPPIKGAQPAEEEQKTSSNEPEKITDERLKNIEPKMVEMIENEIMYTGSPVTWDDIAGLEFAKKTIKEIVVWPMLRPDIFTGLRGPPRGILLFGPPGTGKTLIGKCIASQSKSTFFSISASTLTSKWVGEGEKMVRALFAVARVQQPSVIFIDEIDSLLSQRSDTEHESSRRMKTEFLVQLDGATTSQEDRLLVVGATNRPQELDEAARRRLVKRLYIPLPEFAARKQIIKLLMAPQPHHLEEDQLNDICNRTDGYSCADMTNLCKEAAYGPIRSISFQDIEHISPDQVRPITSEDFDCALLQVRASVSTQDLALYEDWNSRYGSGAK